MKYVAVVGRYINEFVDFTKELAKTERIIRNIGRKVETKDTIYTLVFTPDHADGNYFDEIIKLPTPPEDAGTILFILNYIIGLKNREQ